MRLILEGSELIQSKNVYDEVQDYRNLSDKSSFPTSEVDKLNYFFENYTSNQNLNVLNTPFEPKLPVMSNELEYLEELDNRPVDSHYNTEKGYKFDVKVKDDEKFVSPSNRLGDPDVLPHPLLTLLR